MDCNRPSRDGLQDGFWGNRPIAIAVLIGSGPVINFAIAAVGGRSRPFLRKRHIPTAMLIGNGACSRKIHVTARRQDGKERSKPPELQKVRLIQPYFPPFWRFSTFFTFAFPHSQCTVGARPYTQAAEMRDSGWPARI